MKLYNQSLEISRQLGDQRGLGTILGNIATICYNKEEYGNSFRYAIEAYSLLKQIQSPAYTAWIQSILVDIKSKLGNSEFQNLLDRCG